MLESAVCWQELASARAALAAPQLPALAAPVAITAVIRAPGPAQQAVVPLQCSSVKRKRQKQMNRHKQRKLRRRERNKNKGA